MNRNMLTKEKLASSIMVTCPTCKNLLHAEAEDLQLHGNLPVQGIQTSNYYFYIVCPACHTRVIIPPESWPTEN